MTRIKRLAAVVMGAAVFLSAAAALASTTQPAIVRSQLRLKPDGAEPVIIRDQVRGEFYSATGDKPFSIAVQPSFTGGLIRFENCVARDVKRGPGIHTDGWWLAGTRESRDLVVEFEKCVVARIDGPSILVENGSFKRIYFKDCEVDWKYEFKLMPGCVIEELVFDGCVGNVSINYNGGQLKKLYLNNHRGSANPNSSTEVIDGLPDDLRPKPPPATRPAEDREGVIEGKRYRLVESE